MSDREKAQELIGWKKADIRPALIARRTHELTGRNTRAYDIIIPRIFRSIIKHLEKKQ